MAMLNFMSVHAPDSDALALFGALGEETLPDTEVPLLFDPANETMAHLMVQAGAFSSVTQARKNGWDKPIPAGWSEHKVGKHTRIWVWNPVD